MNKEQLSKKTVNELRTIAKQYSIVGRWDMKKAQLIDSIVNAQNGEDGECQQTQDKRCTSEYLESVGVGALVAFRKQEGSDKYLTGKIVKIDKDSKTLIVETKLGSQFTLNYEQVDWVKAKTTKRWPKWIYQNF